MTQVTIINSKLIHNLQFEMMYNGYSYGVQNETKDFAVGRNYSPAELAQGNELAAEAIMLEGNKLYNTTPNGYVNALITDSQYSKQGFENNLKRVNLCAYWQPEKAFKIFVAGSKLESLKIFVSTMKQALQLAKNYAKVNGLDTTKAQAVEVGQMTDHIKQHWIDTQTRKAEKVLMCKTMKRELFTLSDNDNQPVEETEFFKWLDDNKITDHNTIKTRDQFLKSIGFNMALHKLTSKQISALGHILSHHFNIRIKPTLQGAK